MSVRYDMTLILHECIRQIIIQCICCCSGQQNLSCIIFFFKQIANSLMFSCNLRLHHSICIVFIELMASCRVRWYIYMYIYMLHITWRYLIILFIDRWFDFASYQIEKWTRTKHPLEYNVINKFIIYRFIGNQYIWLVALINDNITRSPTHERIMKFTQTFKVQITFNMNMGLA